VNNSPFSFDCRFPPSSPRSSRVSGIRISEWNPATSRCCGSILT
jgi:hypothetical protein